MIISQKLKETISDFSIIILSILPLWLFDKSNLLNIRILVFFIFLLVIFYILLIIINRFDKKYTYLFLSLIIFYGLDSKISFWIFFENQVFLGWYKYLFSFLFCLIFLFIIFLSLKKSIKSKRIFLICLSTLIIINIVPNYFHKNQIYVIENIDVKKKK